MPFNGDSVSIDSLIKLVSFDSLNQFFFTLSQYKSQGGACNLRSMLF